MPTGIAFRSLILTALISICAAAHAGSSVIYDAPSAPTDAPAKGKHIVFLTGDEEYRSEEGLPMLAKIFSQRHGFKCTVLFALDPDGIINPNNTQSLSSPEALDSADVIVMLIRWRNYPEATMKHFVEAVQRGVPIIALRTSTHAFKFKDGLYASYNDWGKRVLGEGWVNHWGKHKFEATRAVIEPANKDDPILRGVTDIFVTTDVYEAYPPPDAKILLRGQVLSGMNSNDAPAHYKKKHSTDNIEQDINDPMMPIAWTRTVRNESGHENRILCTTMGAATDLQNESLRRLIVNAVYWSLGIEVPPQADVTYVDPFHPSMYGFDGYTKGVKPADLNIKPSR